MELDCFPDAEKLAGAYGFKGTHRRQAVRELAAALEAAVRRARPVPAEREGDAVRKRLPDGAGRRARSTKWCWGRRSRWRCRQSEGERSCCK